MATTAISNDVSLIMTRVSAGLFNSSDMDKTLLLNLELKRQERRRNLRYRTSVALDSEGVTNGSVRQPRESKAHQQKTVDEYAKELEQWLKKMKCTGVTGIKLESFSEIKVGISDDPLDPGSPSLEPYPNLWTEKFKYKGYKDEAGRAKGRAVLEMENGDCITGIFHEGLRQGECRIETSRNNLSHIVGNYHRDQLHGKAKVGLQDDTWLEGFFEQGILHGFVRKYNTKGILTTFGFYHNGVPKGIWWKLIEDGGAVVGEVDDQGRLTGPDIAFLYPDFKTAFLGHFEDGQLKAAQATSLVCVVKENKILIPLFEDPDGPIYNHEISDYEFMTTQPLLPDPYEQQMVEVRPSTVPGANEGLFCKKKVSNGTVLAFYNGIRREPKRTFDEPDWVKSAYRIFDPTKKKGSLDIPHEYIDIKKYCATVAHKTNHSFLPSAEFDQFDHPRFGPIPCLLATTDIEEDEEIFVHYCYQLNHCPEWYTEAYAQSNYPIPNSFKEWQGQLHGRAKVAFADGEWLEGFFCRGILHGFVRRFDEKGRLKVIANYRNGSPYGVCWRIIRGGGVVVGRVNAKGCLTGIRIAYIYPDFKTAFLGSFEDGVMESAQAVTLKAVVDDRGIKIPIFTEPRGPLYKREVSDYDHVTNEPLLPDPYESIMICVKKSNVPGANDGLFAKKQVEPNTIVAFYNGVRLHPLKAVDAPDWEDNSYRIFDPTRKDGTIDIPKEFIKSANYCATSAHKTNHSFMPNAEFVAFDHPRFGLVPCILSTQDIGENEEIFVHYGYELDDCPVWYEDAWQQGNYPVPASFKEWYITEEKKGISLEKCVENK